MKNKSHASKNTNNRYEAFDEDEDPDEYPFKEDKSGEDTPIEEDDENIQADEDTFEFIKNNFELFDENIENEEKRNEIKDEIIMFMYNKRNLIIKNSQDKNIQLIDN